MIQITEIAFVGYPVADITRARAFYEGILGLKPTMADEIEPGQWWVEYDIGPGTLALSTMWPPSGESGPVAALEVADFEAAKAAVEAAGVAWDFGPIETPVCFLGSVKDPEGNALTLHQRKASAPSSG